MTYNSVTSSLFHFPQEVYPETCVVLVRNQFPIQPWFQKGRCVLPGLQIDNVQSINVEVL
jgi:hypothetical protein